ncbi:MAG: AAA domain-containing protein [Bacteroidota bacterium]|nr:AAA domain-containing protein [Bacteroidota bacterium]
MSAKITNTIRYFKACYQADKRSGSIFNFLSDSVSNKIFFEDKEEYLTGFLPYLPIDKDKAEDLKKNSLIWNKERELVYCSLFIAGKTKSENKYRQHMFSPLLICPAEIIEHNNILYLQPDIERLRINNSTLGYIFEETDDNSKSELYEQLFNSIHGQDIDTAKIYEISSILNEYIEHQDTSGLIQYPDLLSQKEAKKKIARIKHSDYPQNHFELLSVSACGMIKKSTDTRGIINELDEIAEKNSFSVPLQNLFKPQNVQQTESLPVGKTPVILNHAQVNALKNSSRFPLSVIIGPPGTGKTYTISALAIEQMSKGKSVLIASRTDQAVDVIADKIEGLLNSQDPVIRAGRKQYLRQLKKDLENILSGYFKQNQELSAKLLNKNISRLSKRISKKEQCFLARAKKEMKRGEFFADDKQLNSFFGKIRRRWIEYRLNKSENLSHMLNSVETALDIKHKTIQEFISEQYAEQVINTLSKNRKELMTLQKALKARVGSIQETLFSKIDLNVILKTFPVWLVKMSDIYKVLPLKKELFDIAVIDEATQCDIASTLPIFQRAKRVVLTGDPKQLRHISFLSRAQQNILYDKFKLSPLPKEQTNYRDNSILDITLSSIGNHKQISTLNEHYRSLPAIIRFSNKQFYNDTLRIMSSLPNQAFDEGIRIKQVDGKREKSGYNKAEADFIMNKIAELIAQKQTHEYSKIQSVGILSPFRAQAEYISKRVKQELHINDLLAYNISVGTAYAFQGEERDIMFISMAVDNDSHFMAFRHIEKPNVFNVAVTRARSLQYIVHSINSNQLDQSGLLHQYLESFKRRSNHFKSATRPKDKFALEVKQCLEKKNFSINVGFPVAGYTLDLVAEKNKHFIAIDLIGYPGQFAETFTTERYRMLNRAGLKSFPLPYSAWKINKTECINEICQFIS